MGIVHYIGKRMIDHKAKYAVSLLLILVGFIQSGFAQVGIFDDHMDIGTPSVAGSAEYDGQTAAYTVIGSGTDIWGTADHYQFVYREVPLDAKINLTARVVLDEGDATSGWAKAGLMIRDSLEPGSAHGYALITSATNHYLPHWREVTDGESGFIGFENQVDGGAGDAEGQHDGKVEIERLESGLSVNFYYYDPDTDERIFVGENFVDFFNEMNYVGLAVCARDDGAMSTGTFTGVELYINNELVPPPAIVPDWSLYQRK